MSELLSLATGFIKGRAEMAQSEREQERNKPLADLKKQALKLEVEKQKSQQKFQDLIYQILQGQGGGTAAPAESTQPPQPATPTQGGQAPSQGGQQGGGIMDILSDPRAMMTLKMGGQDLTGLGRYLSDMKETSPRKQIVMDPQQAQKLGVPIGTEIGIEYNPRTQQPIGEPKILSTPKPITRTIQTPEGTYEQYINPVTRKPFMQFKGQAGTRQAGQQPFTGNGRVRIKPKEPMQTGAAGKLGLAQSSLRAMQDIKEYIYNQDGSINWSTVAKMSGPFKGGVPFTAGRAAKASMLEALEGKIRIESGAAVPDAEIERLMVRFMPSPLDYQMGTDDPDSLAKRKIKRLEEYLHGVIEKLDPAKAYSKDAINMVDENGEIYMWEPGNPSSEKGRSVNDQQKTDPLGIR